jgi:hypothetical protein
MRTQCQITVKRSERRVDLTVAAEQQPRGVQVVEWVGLAGFFSVREHIRVRVRRVCGGGHSTTLTQFFTHNFTARLPESFFLSPLFRRIEPDAYAPSHH